MIVLCNQKHTKYERDGNKTQRTCTYEMARPTDEEYNAHMAFTQATERRRKRLVTVSTICTRTGKNEMA